MIQDIVKYTNFLIENNLTATQDVYCRLISSEQEGYKDLPSKQEAIRNFYHYYNKMLEDRQILNSLLIDDLVEKGYIQPIGDNPTTYDDYEVTSKYLDLVYDEIRDYEDLFEEFWDLYPAFAMKSDGGKMMIGGANKEELFDTFVDKCSNDDPQLIVDALKVAISKDEVMCRADNWLNSEMYRAYRNEVENGDIENISGIKQSVL